MLPLLSLPMGDGSPAPKLATNHTSWSGSYFTASAAFTLISPTFFGSAAGAVAAGAASVASRFGSLSLHATRLKANTRRPVASLIIVISELVTSLFTRRSPLVYSSLAAPPTFAT